MSKEARIFFVLVMVAGMVLFGWYVFHGICQAFSEQVFKGTHPHK